MWLSTKVHMQAHNQPANANARNPEHFTHDRPSGFSVMHEKVEVKQPMYKAWTGPHGSRRFRLADSMTIGAWRWQGQPCAPTAFTRQEIFLVLISIRAPIKCATTCLHVMHKHDNVISMIPPIRLSPGINLLATDCFQILAHPVFKMWVIQKPSKVALWNKRHFEEKKWRLYSMFKTFSTDICWINIKWGI